MLLNQKKLLLIPTIQKQVVITSLKMIITTKRQIIQLKLAVMLYASTNLLAI